MLRLLLLAVLIAVPVAAPAQPAPTAPVDTLAAYVDAVFRAHRTAEYETAADRFLDMLRRYDAASPAEQSTIRRHVARFAALLPPSVLRQVFDGLDADGEIIDLRGRLHDGWTLRPGAGTTLVQWWRSQDPLLATAANERVVEHLQRAAHADSAYAHPRHPTGWDDRGLVYVRLGAPALVREIDYSSACLTRAVLQSTTVFSGDLPKNEIWRYGPIDDPHLFVFSAYDGAYELVAPNELIAGPLRRPGLDLRSLTTGPVTTGGAANANMATGCAEWMGWGTRGQIALLAMQETYRTLMHLDGQYVDAYSDVTDYIMTPATQKLPSERMAPRNWAQSFLSRQQTQEERLLLRREREMPRSRSTVLDAVPLLALEARTARFLNPDGATRTEVFWTLPTQALTNTDLLASLLTEGRLRASDRYLVRTTAVWQTPTFGSRPAHLERLAVRVPEDASATPYLPVQRFSVRSDTALAHLAAQWDVYPLVGSGAATTLGTDEPVGRAVFRRDSLRTLDAQPGQLTMSDPVPVLAASLGAEASLDAVTPYPFSGLAPSVDLGLYFEVYGLTFGADDRTRYTVEYEIARRETDRGLLDFLRRSRDERTTSRARYEATSSTAREAIALDLDDWDGTGELLVTVRVTDMVRGQATERTIRFDALGAAASR